MPSNVKSGIPVSISSMQPLITLKARLTSKLSSTVMNRSAAIIRSTDHIALVLSSSVSLGLKSHYAPKSKPRLI